MNSSFKTRVKLANEERLDPRNCAAKNDKEQMKRIKEKIELNKSTKLKKARENKEANRILRENLMIIKAKHKLKRN